MPNLLQPLFHFLRPLVYDLTRAPLPFKSSDVTGFKILSEPLLSQMSTILPSDLVFTRLRNLYTGSKFGFSIRSLESKIMKWNAPTIMLLSGRPIDPSVTSKNKTYELFKTDFPKFYPTKKDSSGLPENPDNSRPVVFMIYIKKPWKISNSESFGDEETYIVQLSPRQIVYKTANFNSAEFAYFNTIGGGFGFGSKPPLSKGMVRIFKPGEISLTVEPSIEVANFRHLSVPGTFDTGSCFDKSNIPEFEIWFTISELEVWGCGTEKELEEQRKLWEWENREAEARKRLNVKNWDDGKALLEMAGIIGSDTRSGGSV
ncbi:unnamed protein product [Ambrosiozyma monospora]|uniref:Unnamed protein product n=1 Tax=Ambrosiozyma monospora TaxID=43982 RepID=A0ACB5SYT6_AMBMO|nr:unnamed protein product [Ambrosiozyma monospora]